jgi:hypothetical protein
MYFLKSLNGQMSFSGDSAKEGHLSPELQIKVSFQKVFQVDFIDLTLLKIG